MFGSRLSTKSLAHVCRSLGTLLNSGVDVKKAFQFAAERTGDSRARKALARISLGISRGEEISEAMREQGGAFPDLMIDMMSVAEQSGSMPEILEGLADHYENLVKLRKNFLSAIAWPVLELFLAIFVIAGAILLIGLLGGGGNSSSKGGMDMDLLGFGLFGVSGAITWLVWTLGPLAGLALGYKMLTSSMAGKRFLDPLLMKIPVVGNCMKAFAISRFSWAYYLTQQTGMPMKQSLTASLRATANGAFISRTKIIVDRVQSGSHLTEALAAARIFPEDFLHMVDVGETSGTVPETLQRLSPQFEQQARRTLSAVAVAGGTAVLFLVACLIGFIIIRFVMNYVDLLNSYSS